MAPSTSLATLVERGGVHTGIAGSSPAEVLAGACSALALPAGMDRGTLLKAVLEREALMPTAAGRGLAIPHPRSPLVADEALQRVAVFHLAAPLPWEALDGMPVSTLFLVLSATARSHLAVLAAISHLSRRADFLALLDTRPGTAELAAFIRAAEESWGRASP